MKIESRGVTCLECAGLDLKKYEEQAKNGFGWCAAAELPHFVSVRMARNCFDFAPAAPDVVEKRQRWADKMPLFMRQPDV
jgi:hypothetical protein